MDPDVAEEIKRLRSIVEKTNKDVQKQSNEILSSVVNNSIGFGYPNIEELTLIFYRMRVILIRLQKLHILWDIATKKMVFSTFITTMF